MADDIFSSEIFLLLNILLITCAKSSFFAGWWHSQQDQLKIELCGQKIEIIMKRIWSNNKLLFCSIQYIPLLNDWKNEMKCHKFLKFIYIYFYLKLFIHLNNISIYFSTFFSWTTHSITLPLRCNINQGDANVEFSINFFYKIPQARNWNFWRAEIQI